VRVMPQQADEFTCTSCFLVHHRSRLARETRGQRLRLTTAPPTPRPATGTASPAAQVIAWPPPHAATRPGPSSGQSRSSTTHAPSRRYVRPGGKVDMGRPTQR
jgi:hypothetical protein